MISAAVVSLLAYLAGLTRRENFWYLIGGVFCVIGIVSQNTILVILGTTIVLIERVDRAN